ncbi:MAG TPA: efflux RND transporter periplasmic adaptor subunit [Desulfurivibrionaceae bacterium]|nr:efflux RND transporter periplasmic adaptor subunit [Desulfurivibrionaceae bacterium]
MDSKVKIARLSITGLLLGTMLVAGCKGKPQGGPPPMGPPEVGVISLATQPVTLTMELPGRTAPHLIAEVRPQVGGLIRERLFTEGSDVKAGQVLYQIEPASYQATLATAQANLARAKTDKIAAEAALVRVEANAAPLRLKAQRYKELVAINAVSTQEYDDVVAALQQAEATIQGAQAAIQGAAAAIQGAEAALTTAQINLAYTQVTAPISGRIGKSEVTTGALVTASQPQPLATIQQLNPIYVDLNQTSAERLKMLASRAGAKKGGAEQARLKLMLEDGTPYAEEGTLKFSDVTVEPSTGSVTLRALMPNPRQLLLPGMFVRGLVQEGVVEQAILVPQRGVTRNPAGAAMVMVVGAEEKVEPRVIKVERTIGDSWLVNEGLQAGDRVILEGLQKARPGTEVKAVPFGSKLAEGPAGGAAAAGAKR